MSIEEYGYHSPININDKINELSDKVEQLESELNDLRDEHEELSKNSSGDIFWGIIVGCILAFILLKLF